MWWFSTGMLLKRERCAKWEMRDVKSWQKWRVMTPCVNQKKRSNGRMKKGKRNKNNNNNKKGILIFFFRFFATRTASLVPRSGECHVKCTDVLQHSSSTEYGNQHVNSIHHSCCVDSSPWAKHSNYRKRCRLPADEHIKYSNLSY